MKRVVAVFRKTARPRTAGESPTYKETTFANTLNTFDIGGVLGLVNLLLRSGQMKSCQPWLCIEGNGMRPSHLGVGMSANAPMYTLNTTEVHVVMFEEEGNESESGSIAE